MMEEAPFHHVVTHFEQGRYICKCSLLYLLATFTLLTCYYSANLFFVNTNRLRSPIMGFIDGLLDETVILGTVAVGIVSLIPLLRSCKRTEGVVS